MIKFYNTQVFNFEGAIRGMRNPLESWGKIDSEYIETQKIIRDSSGFPCYAVPIETFHIGENDLNLMQRLIKAGNDHSKFMRQIMISVDIDAPLYWWKEFDTYKVGTVANSTSTMHTIHKKEFTKDMFSWEHSSNEYIDFMLSQLNGIRDCYLETKLKIHWYQLIQMLPSSFHQLRTTTLNYAVLRNMYHSRKTHKLDEWSVGFVEWVKTLPYANELICSE